MSKNEVKALPIIIAMIITLMFIMSSCARDDLEEEDIYVSAAYPPFACTNLEPVYLLIKINGKQFNLKVTEVKGGLITDSITLSHGKYFIEEIKVYDISGNLTHKVRNVDTIGDMQVIGVPFTQDIHENVPWIMAQLFCD